MAARSDRPPADDADQSRRTLIRGVALVGLAGVAGFPLAACGGGDGASGALAATDADAIAGAGSEAATAGPNPNRKATKSDVYKRTPEPRPARTKAPKSDATAEATAGPTTDATRPGGKESGAKGGENLATARKGEPAEPDAAGGRKPKKTATPSSAPEPLAPGALARTEDIPVGGGKAFEAEKIIVTQPTKGTFKAFSAKCTHTGCIIDKVAEGAIICPCHGSRFGIADGAVQKGPAMMPLPAEPIAVDTRGNISRG